MDRSVGIYRHRWDDSPTTAGGGATCGDGIDGGACRAVPESLGVGEMGRVDAGGTAAAATALVLGDARSGTVSRTPVVSPSCPRRPRCT